MQADSLQKMVEIRSRIPSAVYDLRYATKKNFTGQRLYEDGSATFLRLPVVQALKKVDEELMKEGLGLKIFDAYRPHSVTRKMWELIQDDRYVADPSKGSGHNRGLSIDLTLVNRASGEELDMGTGFDNFTDTAHHSFSSLPQQILENRKQLRNAMEAAGFRALPTEWWHYSWPNDRNYAVLDLGFKTLRKNR